MATRLGWRRLIEPAARVGWRGGLGLAALAAIAAPGLPSQWLPGLPLTPTGLVLAGAVLVAWVGLPAPPARVGRWLGAGLALALLLKLGLAALYPPAGLIARYWASASMEGRVERSTDFLWLRDATRVDQALDFRGTTFPIHFFNDTYRFNFYTPDKPARHELPFAARWEGTLAVPSDGQRRFRIEAVGRVRVWLDGAELLALEPAPQGQRTEAQRQVAAGVHELRIDYLRPQGPGAYFQLQWEPEPGAPLETVGFPYLAPGQQAVEHVQTRRQLAGMPATGVDGLIVLLVGVWLAFGLEGLRRATWDQRGRAALALVPALFLAYGAATHADLAGRVTILSGGNDWLTYESQARDILFHGPLMPAEERPFYYQPLYPYALAIAHLLTGEGLFGLIALQYAGLGLVLIATALLGARLFGWPGGVAAFVLFLWFLRLEHLAVAGILLNENLFMPLLMASLLALVSLARRRGPPGWRRGLLTGVLLGVTALARSQFLLVAAMGLLLLGLAWWRRDRIDLRRIALGLAALGAGLALSIAPATARNWMVSRQVVLIASSGSINLVLTHQPPPELDLSSMKTDPLYEALKLDTYTRTALEYMRRDPVRYFGGWLQNAAFAVGLTGFFTKFGYPQVRWEFLAICSLYLLAFALRATRRLETWLVHAFVGSHLLVLMATSAHGYGYRLILPMYAPIVAVAAQVPLVALLRLAALVRPRGGRRRAHPGRPTAAQSRAAPPAGQSAQPVLRARGKRKRGR